MSELSTMIEALVADLDLVLGTQIATDDEAEPGTCTVRYAYRESGGKYGEVTADELDDFLAGRRYVYLKESGEISRERAYRDFGLDKDGTKPAFDPKAALAELRERLEEDIELQKAVTEKKEAFEREVLGTPTGGNKPVIPNELESKTGERTLLEHHREQDRVRGEDRAEQLQAVLDSFKTRERVLNEAGLDGKNVEEQVKPLAQALPLVEAQRVSIPLPDRERLVALLHSQTRLTDERVEDMAQVLRDAQPVSEFPDLRPALQENLTALGKSLYWLRECLKPDTDPFIRQHLSRGLEQIQIQMGKTERLIQETR